jgi:periplasmic divalent cation tolerance protein
MVAGGPASELVTVLVSVPEGDTGRAIGRAVVDAGLAACAQILPMTSVYRGQGAVVEDGEALLVLKTRASLFVALAAAIRARHPYDVPQITALPIVAVDPAYRDWVLAETAAAARST